MIFPFFQHCIQGNEGENRYLLAEYQALLSGQRGVHGIALAALGVVGAASCAASMECRLEFEL